LAAGIIAFRKLPMLSRNGYQQTTMMHGPHWWWFGLPLLSTLSFGQNCFDSCHVFYGMQFVHFAVILNSWIHHFFCILHLVVCVSSELVIHLDGFWRWWLYFSQLLWFLLVIWGTAWYSWIEWVSHVPLSLCVSLSFVAWGNITGRLLWGCEGLEWFHQLHALMGRGFNGRTWGNPTVRTSCSFVSLQLECICSICFRLHSLEDHAFGMLFLLLQTLVLCRILTIKWSYWKLELEPAPYYLYNYP
jgi:hypothetical protein